MKASLIQLIDRATLPLTKGDKSSVTLLVSSRYLPYIDEIIDPKYGKGQFFNFYVQKKDLPSGVEYKFLLKISKK